MASTLVLSARLRQQAEYETWQLAKTGSYDLLLNLGPLSSSASVLHANSGRVLWQVSYAYDLPLQTSEAKAQLEMMVNAHEQLRVSNYNTVRVALGWGGVVFIPQEFWSVAEAEQELAVVLGAKARTESLEFYKHAGGIVSAFYADENSLDSIRTQYRASRVVALHHTAAIAQQLQDMSAANGPSRAAVYFEQGFATLVVLKGKTWQLANRYAIKTPQDVTYFTILALKETLGTHEGIPVSLYGDLNRYAEWLAPLKSYLPMSGAGAVPAAWAAHQATEQDLAAWFGTLAISACV